MVTICSVPPSATTFEVSMGTYVESSVKKGTLTTRNEFYLTVLFLCDYS